MTTEFFLKISYRFYIPLFLMFSMVNLNAQNGIAILPFEDGKVLSKDDINFLNYVINGIGTEANSRGTSTDVTIGDSKLSEGSTISNLDAQNIQTLLKEYGENQTELASMPESRGQMWCGYCCYYYWWDSWYGVYRYRWYYCCGC
jgi:hypothetical protein